MIRPPVRENILQYKDTSGGAVHTTGKYTTPYLSSASYATTYNGKTNITQAYFDLLTYLGTTTYTGYIKIVITGTRHFDGSELHLGEVLYWVTPSANQFHVLVPTWQDATALTWVNGGRTGNPTAGLAKYLIGEGTHNGRIIFAHETFAFREKDPLYNYQFVNDYRLDYNIKVYFNSRRESTLTEVNSVFTVPLRSNSEVTFTDASYSTVDDGKSGRTAAKTLNVNSMYSHLSPGVWVDETNNFIFSSYYANEATGNVSYISTLSEAIKDNSDPTKSITTWQGLSKQLSLSGITTGSYTYYAFAIDYTDPGNGNRPTIYHNGAWNGAAYVSRVVGFTPVDGFMDNTYINGTDAYGTESGWNTLKGHPIFSTNGHCNVANLPSTGPAMAWDVHGVERLNNRPVLMYGVNAGGCGIALNNGTYAAPVYDRLLLLKGGTDTATNKYTTSTSVPAVFQNASFEMRVGASDRSEWIYFSGDYSGSLYFGRMKYSGVGSTISDYWDWNNWTVQELFNYALPGSDTLTSTATTGTVDTMGNNSVRLFRYLDHTDIVNGHPVFYGQRQGYLYKFYHNGGSAGTVADWSYEKIIGRPTVTTTMTEGTGVGVSGGCLGSSSTASEWGRMDKAGDWLYIPVRSSTQGGIGRVNVNSASGDYGMFKILGTSYTPTNGLASQFLY